MRGAGRGVRGRAVRGPSAGGAGGRHVGLPPQALRVEHHLGRLGLAALPLLPVVGHHVLLLEDDVLALPVLDHAHGLQRAHDVVGVDGHLLADVFDHELLAAEVAQVLEQHVLPVRAVRDEPQVRERLLRGAHLAFLPRQQVAEVDEEASEALALVRRQRQDARHVVPLERVLLLAEVAHGVTSIRIVESHDIKEEGFHVVV